MNFLFKVIPAIILLLPNGLIAQDISQEEVVFRNGDYVLNGTLVLPAASRNVPVLVFMGGIEEWGDFHPTRQDFINENFANYFPQNGIGVFYYDPRGMGKSTGRWHRATLPEFADDANAAINYLKQRREVDADRIGIIGHGEDGWVAQIVAADNPDNVQFMVSLAGPVFDAQSLLINQYHNEYVCAGQDSSRAYEKASQKAVSHENWVSIFPLTKRWRHMKMKQDYDPTEYLKRINIPSLFVFGENDGEVYHSWSLNQLNNIFPGALPNNFTVHTITGANHYFKVEDRCYEEEIGNIQKNYSFRFKEVVRNWIFEKL